MHSPFLLLASIAAFLAVAMGAFGAHGLRHALDAAAMAVYQTAVQYHMWHALGLGIVALLLDRFPSSGLLRAAGWFLFGGIVVFSGSLYVLSVTGLRWLGAVTPVGGLAFLIGWFLLIVFAVNSR